MTLRIDPALSSVKLASLQKGLVLNMSLDQESYNPATKRFTDKTPYSNHGTSYNSATFTTDRMGQPNRAMSFNGTDDFIDCGNDESLNITDAITVEAWVKINSYIEKAGIVSKYGSSSPRSWRMNLNKDSPYDKIRFLYFDADNVIQAFTSTKSLNLDEWYHVAVTYDGAGKIYINSVGETLTTGGKSIYPSARPVYIGRQIGDFFNGTIDEVRIYNRALSAEEITSLYEQYRPKFLI